MRHDILLYILYLQEILTYERCTTSSIIYNEYPDIDVCNERKEIWIKIDNVDCYEEDFVFD